MLNSDSNELLEEMLDLAGVNDIDEAEKDEDEDEKVEPDDEKKEDEDEPEDEVNNEWSVDIGVGGKFKIEIYPSYIYMWYRNRKSPRLVIPSKLRPFKDEVHSYLHKILSFIEKVS